MTRRILAVVLLVLLVGGLVAGCGQAAAPAKPVEKPAAPAKKKVGLVFDVGGRGDLSFNDSAYAGLEKANKEFADKIEVKYLEPSASGENREELLRLLASQKYDLIFAVGFLFTDQVAKVAKEFPAVKFAIIDGYIPDLKKESNVSCISFKEQEGSFLVGAAAAYKTKTNKVGFVGGMKGPLIERFEAGYVAGAKYSNAKVTTVVDYVGTTGDAFRNAPKGKELALKQYGSNVDVIYHASGASGIGVFEAAVARKKMAIGVDSDQSLTATKEQQPYILTSMIKRVDVSVYEAIKNFLGGKFEGGYREFGLSDGGISYAVNDINKAMMADITAKLEDLKQKVVKGEIVVPSNNEELKTFLNKIKR
jgi:basic membrane protein A and related proteins